jgi:AcrR family transcriptional regulator
LVCAARRLFAERGYLSTTVEAIAAQAGTAPQTFYKVIGSKRAVIFALLDEMAVNADPGALAAALEGTDRADEQLAMLVDYRVRLFTGAIDILEAARAAAPGDPDVAAMWAEGEARRRRNQQQPLAAWRDSGALHGDLARADVILWALTGPDLYRLYVLEGEWPVDTYRDWLTGTLRAQLFGAEPRRS